MVRVSTSETVSSTTESSVASACSAAVLPTSASSSPQYDRYFPSSSPTRSTGSEDSVAGQPRQCAFRVLRQLVHVDHMGERAQSIQLREGAPPLLAMRDRTEEVDRDPGEHDSLIPDSMIGSHSNALVLSAASIASRTARYNANAVIAIDGEHCEPAGAANGPLRLRRDPSDRRGCDRSGQLECDVGDVPLREPGDDALVEPREAGGHRSGIEALVLPGVAFGTGHRPLVASFVFMPTSFSCPRRSHAHIVLMPIWWPLASAVERRQMPAGFGECETERHRRHDLDGRAHPQELIVGDLDRLGADHDIAPPLPVG